MNHGNISPEIAKGLKVLQARIAKAEIPSSKLDETLNMATWNIREFGKKARSAASVGQRPVVWLLGPGSSR